MDFSTIVSSAKSFLSYVSTFDYTGIILLIMVISMVALFIKMNGSKSSTFFYDQLFLDGDGKASTSKLAQLVALLLSSWAFVHLTLKSNLTEWYFLSYMGIWVLNRGFTKWTDMQKEINKLENK